MSDEVVGLVLRVGGCCCWYRAFVGSWNLRVWFFVSSYDKDYR
jgi:hypothetical protein